MSIGAGVIRGHLITLRRFLLTFWRDIRAGQRTEAARRRHVLHRPVPLAGPRQGADRSARTSRPTASSPSSIPTSGCRSTSGSASCRS